jgi:hypothetical protein
MQAGRKMASKREIFPVVKVWDEMKGKWNKRPAVRGSWQGYEASAEEQARAQNLGLGIPPGRVVIDVDAYKGVTTDQIDAALNVRLDWDAARIQRTVSGGEHYCFVLPTGVDVRQGDSLLGISGFDTRASGKGWICSGDGYEDLTVLGLPDALWEEDFPVLPLEAVRALAGDHAPEIDESEGGTFDLELAIAAQPLDGIGLDEIREYLERLPDDYLTTYDKWVKVGMAIHHQVGGDKAGALAWAEWSKQCDERELVNGEGTRIVFDAQEIKDKWRSFGRRARGKPTRFDYVIAGAGGRIREIAPIGDQTLLDDVLDDARNIASVDDWQRLKERVGRLTLRQLPSDHRAMIAKVVGEGWAKGAGIGKTEIREALKAGKIKKETGANPGESQRPEWLDGWVYVESTCQFYTLALNYGIKREAFNAKFDRMSECLVAEKRAADVALIDYQIPTVVDTFYFPGADSIFEYEGKLMVNSYWDRRVEPCAVWDDEAQQTVGAFERHMAFLFSDERERRLIIDWMAFVVRNPGKRVNWALMIQGAQGIGKSYLVVALQAIMGDGVKSLDPSAISGRFTGWAHGSLVNAVEELRISGTNKWEILDRLKPFITNATVQIEEKGRDHRTVPNFPSYIFFTNHKDALPIVEDDRRYCIIFSDIQSEAELFNRLGGKDETAKYFDHLFGLTNKRPDALRKYLDEWKYSSEFQNQGRAPETKSKRMINQLSVSDDQLIIEDAIDRHDCACINRQVVDITWLNELCKVDGDELPQTRALTSILLRMGFSPIEKRRVKIGKTGKYHYVWKGAMVSDSTAVQITRDFHEDGEGVPF